MSTLAELQRGFIASLFCDPSAAPAPQGLARGPVALRGLEIYRRQVLGNLHDALAATYPVVLRLVGGAFFRELARQFSFAHASTSGDLYGYGASLAAFLETYPHARHLEYLADVARLEWACHESFHAAEDEALDVHALSQVSSALQGEIRFRLHPAVRLLRSPHAALAIWEANQDGRDGCPDRAVGPQRMLVWRADLRVRLRGLDRDEWTLLTSFARGATLDEAASRLERNRAEGVLGAALRRYAQESVVSGFVAPEGTA